MTNWFDDTWRLSPTTPGFDDAAPPDRRGIAPAMGLVVATGASAVLWIGVVHLIGWIGTSIF